MIRPARLIPGSCSTLLTVLLTTTITPPALAQSPLARADRVRPPGGAVTSPDPAPPAGTSLGVDVGQDVKVNPELGRGVRGRVVSVSDGQLTISRLQYPFPYFRPRKQLTIPKDAIQRIDIVDSVWNGALIGAAAAIGVEALVIRAQCSRSCADNFGRPVRRVLDSLLFVPVGIGIGGAVDASINRTAYEWQPGRRRVTVLPWLDRRARGISFQARF